MTPSLSLECELNRFPIHAFSLQCGTLYTERSFLVLRGEKQLEVVKLKMVLSEKDLDQKREM